MNRRENDGNISDKREISSFQNIYKSLELFMILIEDLYFFLAKIVYLWHFPLKVKINKIGRLFPVVNKPTYLFRKTSMKYKTLCLALGTRMSK